MNRLRIGNMLGTWKGNRLKGRTREWVRGQGQGIG